WKRARARTTGGPRSSASLLRRVAHRYVWVDPRVRRSTQTYRQVNASLREPRHDSRHGTRDTGDFRSRGARTYGGCGRVKMILPALTEAKSPIFRPIKHSLF